MKKLRYWLFALLLVVVSSAREKPRVVVLTDIENEPDDAMSMVRFLTYANQFDIEALVATTSTHQKTASPRSASARSFRRTPRCATIWSCMSPVFRLRTPCSRKSRKACRYSAWAASATARTRPAPKL